MDFQVPELGEGVYEAELVRWLVKPGDPVRRGQGLMEVLTDKATFEVPANFAGQVGELRANPGDTIKVGQVVLTYGEASAGTAESREEAATPKRKQAKEPVDAPAPSTPPGNSGQAHPPLAGLAVKAAPSVRLMARKLGIDLASIRGSGPAGRILIDDLAILQSAQPEVRPAEPPPDYGRPGSRVKLAGIRRKIAEHMVLAKRTIPHYSYVDECDVTDLVRLRDSLKEPLARQGVRLTYLAFLVKAAVRALQQVPIVNSTLDDQAGEIILHDRYHIGIAVSTPAGLIVPVVHDADRRSLVEIAREINRLSNEARAGKIKRDDLLGGVFTVTSVGNVGGLISTPVINHPQVGIMGVGKVVRRPVYDRNGHIRPADLVYLSFSFDHRVVDGAIGAAFGNVVIEHLQNPGALML